MRETQETELPTPAAQTSQYDAKQFYADGPGVLQLWREGDGEHAACRERDEYEDADVVGNLVDKVRGAQLGEEGRDDVGQQDDALGYVGTDEVEGRAKYDDIQDVVDDAWRCQ